jgi:hypothetical protein
MRWILIALALLAIAYGFTSSSCWDKYQTEVQAIYYCEQP